MAANDDAENAKILRTKGHVLHVVKRLGAGGMGETYLVYDHKLGPRRKFVIKILHVELAKDAGAVESFLHEARGMAALDHAHIVEVFWLDELVDGRPLYAMKFINGESLHERLRRRGKLSTYEAILIAIDVLNGLHHGHKHGIVHRDVKPSNVMIALDSRGMLLAILIDFGVMRLTDDVGREFAGTLAYAAPEQITGRAEIGRQTDLFAVGGLLFEMLTGQRPFASFGGGIAGARARLDERPPKLSAFGAFPPDLVDLVDAAFAPDPNDRPRSAKLMADALEKVARTIEAPEPTKQYDSGVTDPITRASLANLTDPEGADYAELLSRASAGLPEPETLGISETGKLLGEAPLALQNQAAASAHVVRVDTRRDPARASGTQPLRAPPPVAIPISRQPTDPAPLAIASGAELTPSYVDPPPAPAAVAAPVPSPLVAPPLVTAARPADASAQTGAARPAAQESTPVSAVSERRDPSPPREGAPAGHVARAKPGPPASGVERRARAAAAVSSSREAKYSPLEIKLRRLYQSYALRLAVRLAFMALCLFASLAVTWRLRTGAWPWPAPPRVVEGGRR